MNRDELHARIQQAADEFANQIMSAFGEALQSIVTDLTEGVVTGASTNPERPSTNSQKSTRAEASTQKAGRQAQSSAKKSDNTGRMARRSNKELEKAAQKVVDLLTKEKGKKLRVEEINAALGTTTKELMRPIKKLVDANRIKKSGERRSTTYFVED